MRRERFEVKKGRCEKIQLGKEMKGHLGKDRGNRRK